MVNKLLIPAILAAVLLLNTIQLACGAILDATLLAQSGFGPTSTVIDLTDASIDSIDAAAFNGYTALQTLQLSKNTITTLPPGVFTPCTALVNLHIDENKLESISANTFTGPALTTVDLSNNLISNIATGAFANNVVHLILNNNKLATVSSASLPTSLQTLNLKNNLIATLTTTSFNLQTGLLNLDLSSQTNQPLNSIADFTFANNKNLQQLILSNNALTTIKLNTFNGLINIQKIDLNNNLIASIDDYAFDWADAIKYIYLNNNKVTSISKLTFFDSPDLLQLDLSQNLIASISDCAFNSLTALNDLDLQSNKLTTLTASTFTGLRALKSLFLQNNLLVTKTVDLSTFSPFISTIATLSLCDNPGLAQVSFTTCNVVATLRSCCFSNINNGNAVCNPPTTTTVPPTTVTLFTRPYTFNALCKNDSRVNFCKFYAQLGYCGTYTTVKNVFFSDFCCASCNALLPTTTIATTTPTTAITNTATTPALTTNPNCNDIDSTCQFIFLNRGKTVCQISPSFFYKSQPFRISCCRTCQAA